MANSRIYFKSEAGGTTTLSRDTSATSGNLVLPASGNVASVDTAVTDNAIARFDSTTGKLQNSGVTIDDNGNVIAGSSMTTFTAGVSRGIAIEPISPTADSEFRVNGSGSWFTSFSSNASGAGFGGWRHIGSTGQIKNWVYTAGSGELQFGTNGAERMRIDSSGNVGIGVTPSAWNSVFKALEISSTIGYSSTLANLILETYLFNNTYFDSTYRYKKDGYAQQYSMDNAGNHRWFTAPSGTAGNVITYTQAMTLDASGRLLIGNMSAAAPLTVLDGMAAFGADSVGFSGASSSNTCLKLGKMITGRSLNAVGTINASGADYAEYEYSNDITITKGQIVGFKADGTLTDKYNEAIRFAIKSTNPSIVGGDTWGIEDIVGKRPEQPVRKLDKTEQVKIEDSEEFETVVIEAGDTDTEWEAIEAKYKEDLADFEARLEVERQKVDRIAYAGKVPVNVLGATAGQYIVAIEKDGGIDGLAVNKADMTFSEYQDAVGRVNKILDDGRAEVAVIIH